MTKSQDTTPTSGLLLLVIFPEIRPVAKVFSLHRDGFRTRRDPWWLWVGVIKWLLHTETYRLTGRTHRPPSPTWPSLWTGKRASQTCRAYPSDPSIWICWGITFRLISHRDATWRWSPPPHRQIIYPFFVVTLLKSFWYKSRWSLSLTFISSQVELSAFHLSVMVCCHHGLLRKMEVVAISQIPGDLQGPRVALVGQEGVEDPSIGVAQHNAHHNQVKVHGHRLWHQTEGE